MALNFTLLSIFCCFNGFTLTMGVASFMKLVRVAYEIFPLWSEVHVGVRHC